MKDSRPCDCSKPWPKMVRLSIGGLDRYYVCPHCGCIRHETAPGPGLLDDIIFYHVNDPRVPEIVWGEARHIMERPVYYQLGLFDDERTNRGY